MKRALLIALSLCALRAFAAPVGDCAGTPSEASVELPSPLSEWGALVCTPYGHIIANRVGWIWSEPGAFRPVMIPSQMVRSNPEPVGNRSYFTKIEMLPVSGEEADAAIGEFEAGFDASDLRPAVYVLTVVSISGESLSFRFFDYGEAKWGMWCNRGCDPDSRFMLLDMTRKPGS